MLKDSCLEEDWVGRGLEAVGLAVGGGLGVEALRGVIGMAGEGAVLCPAERFYRLLEVVNSLAAQLFQEENYVLFEKIAQCCKSRNLPRLHNYYSFRAIT